VRAIVLKLRIVIGADSLELEGDVGLDEVLTLVHDWITALPDAAQRQIDQLTGRTAASTTSLEQAVADAAPR
jgi:hypothetical protein